MKMALTKPNNLSLLTISMMALLTACSPKQDKSATTASATATTATPASVTTSTTSNSTTVNASTVMVAPTAPTVSASAPAPSTNEAMPTIPTPNSNNAPASVPTSTVDDKTLALRGDLTLLFRTLNQLERSTATKQAEMSKKIQNAKTPADQQAFFKEIVKQLDIQKATLNKLKFNDERVAKARDKMVESIDSSRAGTAGLAKNPTATPESNPEIAKAMEASQKSAVEARAMLMQLTKEAGIQPEPKSKGKQ